MPHQEDKKTKQEQSVTPGQAEASNPVDPESITNETLGSRTTDQVLPTMPSIVEAMLLSVRDTNGQLALPPGSRPVVEGVVAGILVDQEALAKHIRSLQLFFLDARDKGELEDWPCHEPLPEAVEDLLLNKGPEALKDLDERTLADLALNYNALIELHQKIIGYLPDAWWNPLVKAGQEAMKRDGITTPPPVVFKESGKE